MACLPCLSINSDLSLFIVHNINGKIKFPKGKINFESADKCIIAAKFFMVCA